MAKSLVEKYEQILAQDQGSKDNVVAEAVLRFDLRRDTRPLVSSVRLA